MVEASGVNLRESSSPGSRRLRDAPTADPVPRSGTWWLMDPDRWSGDDRRRGTVTSSTVGTNRLESRKGVGALPPPPAAMNGFGSSRQVGTGAAVGVGCAPPNRPAVRTCAGVSAGCAPRTRVRAAAAAAAWGGCVPSNRAGSGQARHDGGGQVRGRKKGSPTLLLALPSRLGAVGAERCGRGGRGSEPRPERWPELLPLADPPLVGL